LWDNNDRRNVVRDPVLGTWLALSVVLNVIGMASLVDGVVVWADFIRHIIGIYREVVHEPLRLAIGLVWPAGWPPIPRTAIDLLVMWSCVFLSVNLALYRETGKTALSAAAERVRGVGSFAVFLLISALMFITLPLGTVRHLLTPSRYRYNPYFPERHRATRAILLSLSFVLGLFILVLFLNYQVRRLDPGSA
jgi:hypothetical protein